MAYAQTIASAPALAEAGLVRRTASALAGMLDRLSAAIHVAHAYEQRIAPAEADLKTLGLPRA